MQQMVGMGVSWSCQILELGGDDPEEDSDSK